MSKIISIGTATPAYMHEQEKILEFMQRVYTPDADGRRKLRYLYHHSAIRTRYSVIPDYSLPASEWIFYPPTENIDPFPSLEKRMEWYDRLAAPLSVQAIRSCLEGKAAPQEITHLITVSCTGMSAPGLDIQILEQMGLSNSIFRTSVNFMGCYAAIHALKSADFICRAEPGAKVLIVCTELCTLHFQQDPSEENITSSLLFGDGSAAALITGDAHQPELGLHMDSFYSEVLSKGKTDMAWALSSTGFRMTLSNYIPDLIEADLARLVHRALQKNGVRRKDVTHWCTHPGGRRVLEAIHKSLTFTNGQLDDSYEVLKAYGNMSSPTLLFVLQRIMNRLDHRRPNVLFGVAFGPGLTMETFIASTRKN